MHGGVNIALSLVVGLEYPRDKDVLALGDGIGRRFGKRCDHLLMGEA